MAHEITDAHAGSGISDIGHPGLVRSCHIELPVERVVDHHRRPAAIGARTAFVSDLRLDAGKAVNGGRKAVAASADQVHAVSQPQ